MSVSHSLSQENARKSSYTQIKGRLLGITQLRLSPLVGESITNIVVKAIYFFQKDIPIGYFFQL